MTFTEFERLALHLRELIDRRNTLLSVLESALGHYLTEGERSDMQKVIESLGEEKAKLERRLDELQRP